MSNTKSYSTTSAITLTGLFCALTCIATMIIKIPTPATAGYIHLGDAFVILSAIFPGGFYGIVASSLGSFLADVFSGYISYAPITLIIKGASTLAVFLTYKYMRSFIKNNFVRLFIGGIFSTLIVGFGYLAYELFIYGSAAFASLPLNLVQGAFGIGISLALFPFFCAIPELKKYSR